MKNNCQLRHLRLLALFALLLIVGFTQCNKDEEDDPKLGKLFISPQETIINVNTMLSVHIKVPPGQDIADSIKLVKYAVNGTSSTVGYLFDDGDLVGKGDDIRGDGVYSGKFPITELAKGEVKFKAVADLTGKQGKTIESDQVIFNVYNDLNPADVRSLYVLQGSIANQLNTYLNGSQNNAGAAVNQLVDWLKSQPQVQSVNYDGTSYIEIKYKSGLLGGVVISLLGDDGLSDTRGGFHVGEMPFPDRNATPVIPLAQQTRGEEYMETKSSQAFDPNTIGNRNVFIYAAFEASWRNNERPHIINILDSLACGKFQVTAYTNQQATVARLYEIVNYGMVVFATHGSGGKSILTGEIADTTLLAYQSYKPMMQGANPKMGISTNMVISKQGTAVTRANVYKVYDPFISALPGTFPQSIILNNSCQSDKTPALRDAFIAKGAKTYYGYSESVHGAFCVPVSRDVFTTLAKNGKTAGEVTRINTTWPDAPNPTFRIRGSSAMKYSLELMNGNFKDGMLGWTKSGDGRVISRLGFVNPTNGSYMGIISTGLGFTTLMGDLSQSFTIPANANNLSFKWNFLSEEFLEFIGSRFQDRFQVVMISEDFGEEILLNKTIDIIAGEFGASKPTNEIPEGIPGNLVSVSPDIVFDKGGVYMTGWQSSEFNITKYRGKCVTLVLRCTDVGDSIYDTAILLDDIKIN